MNEYFNLSTQIQYSKNSKGIARTVSNGQYRTGYVELVRFKPGAQEIENAMDRKGFPIIS